MVNLCFVILLFQIYLNGEGLFPGEGEINHDEPNESFDNTTKMSLIDVVGCRPTTQNEPFFVLGAYGKIVLVKEVNVRKQRYIFSGQITN